MLKPALNNFATQCSENFRSVFEDFSVDFSFIYLVFHSLIFFFSFFLSSLEGPMIIYCFFIKQGLHKKYFKSFNWVGKSIVIIRQLATTKELWLLSYLTRNIGYKVSFHNKLVVPFGYGNKRSLSVFPFKCVYSHFSFPWESVSSLWLIVAMVKKDGYIIFLPYLRINKWNKQSRSTRFNFWEKWYL